MSAGDGLEPALAEQLRELVDKRAIEEVNLRFMRGVDRCDADLIRSAFHEDATDDHGAWKGLGWEFAEQTVGPRLENYEFTAHYVNNSLIDIDGDVAHGETYLTACLKPASSDVLHWFGGRHVDRFERRDGIWRIADKVVIVEWTNTVSHDVDGFPQPLDSFTRPCRGDGQDVSYRR